MAGYVINNRKRIRHASGDMAFFCITYALIILIFLIVLLPVVYVAACSFSTAEDVMAGRVIFWPKNFSLDGYRAVLDNQRIWMGYFNSFIYLFAGTAISLVVTVCCAYPLARKSLPFRKQLNILFTFTMFFSSGMIPIYMLVRDLGMLDTRAAMIIPTALNVYYMIIMRSYMQDSIPSDLPEAASIDGCSDWMYLMKILLPLCKPVLSVIALYYAVAQWNSYFSGFLYLTDSKLYPLQLILREILAQGNLDPAGLTDPALAERRENMAQLLKYSLIVVATLPMMAIYPFVQKFFVKGMMIGAVKG